MKLTHYVTMFLRHDYRGQFFNDTHRSQEFEYRIYSITIFDSPIHVCIYVRNIFIQLGSGWRTLSCLRYTKFCTFCLTLFTSKLVCTDRGLSKIICQNQSYLLSAHHISKGLFLRMNVKCALRSFDTSFEPCRSG